MSYDHINLNFRVIWEHTISPHVPKNLLIFIYEFQYAMQGFVYDM